MTPEDAEILSEAIIAADEREDEAADAFRAMLERGAALTPKQRAWAVGVATGKFVDAEEGEALADWELERRIAWEP